MQPVFQREIVFNQSTAALGGLHPELLAILKQLDDRSALACRFIDFEWWEKTFSVDLGGFLRIMEGWRTAEKQAQYLLESRNDTKQIKTAAGAFESFHQWGCACDLIFRKVGWNLPFIGKDGKSYTLNDKAGWLQTGLPQFWCAAGGEWGGNWAKLVDCAHFQITRKVPIENRFAVSGWWNLGLTLGDISPRPAQGGSSWRNVALMAAAGGGVLLLLRKV